jgi:isoamylase
MLCAGDESGRTQQGHANAYDQDNALSWLDWELTPDQQALLDCTRAVVALVQHHPVLRRRHFWHGQRVPGAGSKDLAWFRPDGLEMLAEDWQAPENRCVGLLLVGETVEPMPTHQTRQPDDPVLLILNAQSQAVSFVLPALQEPGVWEVLLCTDTPLVPAPSPIAQGQEYVVPAQSLALLRYARGATLSKVKNHDRLGAMPKAQDLQEVDGIHPPHRAVGRQLVPSRDNLSALGAGCRGR